MFLNAVKIVKADAATLMALPLYTCRVPAGFPSPADDHLDGRLDLNARLIRNPAATFFVYTDGESMKDAGIFSGDLLVVDRSVRPAPGMVVIACVDGELTVKRYCLRDGRPCLAAENPAFPPLALHDGAEVTIWGVVAYCIHALR